MSNTVLGYALAILSMIGVALFQVFPKIERVKRTGIHHIIFNIYFLVGVIVFCALTTLFLAIFGSHSLSFTVLGMVSGIMLGIASVFVWISLEKMGIAHTTALFNGFAALTGFFEGLAIGETPQNVGLSIFAILILLVAIFGIGFNENVINVLSSLFCHKSRLNVREYSYGNISFSQNENETDITARQNNESQSLVNNSNVNNIDDSDDSPFMTHAIKSRMIGIFCAILGGLIFGTMALPEEFVESDKQEAYYLPSFAIGVCIILTCNVFYAMYLQMSVNFDFKKDDSVAGAEAGTDGVTVIEDDMTSNNDMANTSFFSRLSLEYGFPGLMNPPFYVHQCFGPGFCSGIVWGVSFLATLYAEDIIGYEVAIPIRESSLGLTAVIGIFFFNEITDGYATMFVLLCAVVAVAGCFVLAVGFYD